MLMTDDTMIRLKSSATGFPQKHMFLFGQPVKGYYGHGVYTKHSYYNHGHWYKGILLNEIGESNETSQH
jgi:hypothetical protein